MTGPRATILRLLVRDGAKPASMFHYLALRPLISAGHVAVVSPGVVDITPGGKRALEATARGVRTVGAWATDRRPLAIRALEARGSLDNG